ncbi:hypothetical protein DLJ49_16315 [Rhodovulum sp. 12E13]|uniref:hypothetical protein n=1 Tax=Rhodovulum sp. 12E13 TaxID=2203891 RepID=UPI000E188AFE|nr:hypothetical protein [Rhodovulum sp. 12E13]RDC71091.1 hypothetical protein DLJ49_16315 [Rhodovulum sp. 12E13]
MPAPAGLVRPCRTRCDTGPDRRDQHGAGVGQITATDHRLIHSPRNVVNVGDFDALRPRGTLDRVEQIGGSGIGPQARTARPIGAMTHDPG